MQEQERVIDSLVRQCTGESTSGSAREAIAEALTYAGHREDVRHLWEEAVFSRKGYVTSRMSWSGAKGLGKLLDHEELGEWARSTLCSASERPGALRRQVGVVTSLGVVILQELKSYVGKDEKITSCILGWTDREMDGDLALRLLEVLREHLGREDVRRSVVRLLWHEAGEVRRVAQKALTPWMEKDTTVLTVLAAIPTHLISEDR